MGLVYMKYKAIAFTFLCAIFLSACSDGDSSTEDSSVIVTITGESGVTATFDTNEATVDEVFEFFYDLGGDEFTATIHWGDNTTERVRGSGKARHRYKSSRTYSIAIQVDGQEGIRVGEVRVKPAPIPETTTQTSTSTIPTSIDVTCGGSTLTVRSPSTNRTYSVSIGSGSNPVITVTDLSLGSVDRRTLFNFTNCPAISTTNPILYYYFTTPRTVFDVTITNGSSVITFAPR